MYTPTKIYAKVNQNGVRWIEQDLTTALATEVHTLSQVLGPTRMVLTHDTDTSSLFLFDFFNDATPFVNQFDQQITLGDWFVALGAAALPTTAFTNQVTKQAVFSDAIHAGFSVEMVVPGGVPSAELPWSVKTDLLVTKEGLSGTLIGDNTLASVSGYLHRTYASDKGLYVMQGGRTATVSDMNSLGLISFANLGGIQVIPIVESMLGGLPDAGVVLETPVYVSIPDIDWDTHTAMLVLMGHLIPMGDVFKAIGNGQFEIKLTKYPYLERFLTAEKYMDFSQIRAVVDRNKAAPSMISVAQSRQRDFLIQMLTVSQSFVVAIKQPNVYTNRIALETTPHPCVYMYPEAVRAPVVHHDGRMMNYLLQDQTPKWVLLAPDGTHDNMRMHTMRWRDVNAVDNLRTNRKRLKPGRPSILEIKCDLFI